MNSIPKNRSEETGFPIALLTVVVVGAIVAVLMFANARNRKHESVTIPSTAALTSDGTGLSRSWDAVAIDLSKFFNADRHHNWTGGTSALRGLSDLPSGIVPLDGVPFQIDGIVQLCGVGVRADSSKFPKSVAGIPVARKCSRLHFLHSTGWTMPKSSEIAAYVVHFDDGRREEIPVVFGIDVRDWLFSPKDLYTTNDTAWSLMTSQARENLRIYQSTWTNSRPDVIVKSIDYVSYGTRCAPFLLAITADVPK